MLNILSIAMLIFSALLGIIILLCAIKGFFKGWKKCLVILCRTLLAAIVAFFVVFIFCRLCPAGSLFNTLLGSSLENVDIVSESEYIQQLGGNLIYTLIMPFVFLILFFILNAIFKIPARFIEKFFGIKTNKELKRIRKEKKAEKRSKKENDHTETVSTAEGKSKVGEIFANLGGAGLRIITATFVIMLVLMPFTGILYTFTDGIIEIADTAAEVDASLNIGSSNMNVMGHTITDGEGKLITDEADLLVHETLDPVCNNVFLKLSHSAPMELIYNSFAGSKNVDGKFENEISQVFGVASDAIYLTVKMENYGQPQKDAVTRLFAYVSKSDLHCGIAADVLSGVSNKVLKDQTVFGSDLSVIKKEPTSIAAVPFLEILAKTTPETVSKDLDTMRDVVIIMIDYGVPADIATALSEKNSNNIYKSFDNEDLIYDILVTTYHTDDYRHMTGPVINLMFTVFTRRFDPDASAVDVAGENVENLTDEDLRKEAAIISSLMGNIHNVITSIPALIESSNTMSAVVNSNMEFLGEFADTARDSKFIGEGVNDLIIVMLESDKMNSMRDVADVMIRNIKADPHLDMSNLFLGVQQFVAILDKYENGSGHDTAELAVSLKGLNDTFKDDPKTAAIMKEIINETDMIASSSLSSGGETNNSSQKMMNVFVDKLSSKEYTDEELEHEAKALDYSMQLIQASGQENSSEQLKEIYSGDKMADMVDVMSDSEISSAAINEIAYDENGNKTDDALELSSSMDEADRADFVSQCEQTYNNKLDAFIANPDKTAEDVEEYKTTLKTNMTSLASVFGVNLDFESWDAARAGNNQA